MKISAVDVFCGAGGLTAGLEKAGLQVKAGIDVDIACKFPYEFNTSAEFIGRSATKYSAKDVSANFKGADVSVLVGCAPCQPFSTYTQGRLLTDNEKWSLLRHFGKLIVESRPDVASMENVWPLSRHKAFTRFRNRLCEAGYSVSFQAVDCREYGIPQSRRRLVLMASRLGTISLIPATHPVPEKWATVRDTIQHLKPIKAGKADANDPLHIASALSDLNMKRMQASIPGGTWKDWPNELIAPCHKKETGKTYPGVYGRMEWDKPSPTITGQCFGFGNGRFGHPQQDRAISLREAALLQSFPTTYEFVSSDDCVNMKNVGRMIGNAVPPRLGEIIGTSIVAHLKQHTTSA